MIVVNRVVLYVVVLFSSYRAHEQFGYCQAGTSGVLTSEDRVVIGTPGPHTWKGTLYLFTVSDEFLNRDNTVYNVPMQDSSPVNKYSYLGWYNHMIFIIYQFLHYFIYIINQFSRYVSSCG